MTGKSASGTSRVLRDLRSLRVLLVHPDDQDGQELIAQLQRIGCQVKAFWPPAEKLPDEADLIFLAMRPEFLSMDLPWARRDDVPPIIAVVNYENPTTIEAVLRINAIAVVASPVKSFGLLTSVVLARHLAEARRSREHYVARLEERLAGLRKIAKAKTILMNTRGLSEEDAYKVIREQAMSKRVTTEEIADAVITANEILGFETKTKAGPTSR
jgi:AmiR/NasT family two-component response regulator